MSRRQSSKKGFLRFPIIIIFNDRVEMQKIKFIDVEIQMCMCVYVSAQIDAYQQCEKH